MKVEKVKIEKLNPAKYNPRKDLQPGDPEYEKLKRSIEEFGYVEPIIWNEKTGNIIGGHQRYKMLVASGITEIDCVVLNLDETKEKALNIALNKISGDWDKDKLEFLLTDLQASDFDVDLTGFDSAELSNLFAETDNSAVEEDNFDVDKTLEKIDKPLTKPGDIWLLGEHRLICGDSTSKIDVDRLMENEKAQFIFTDPPWNVAYGSNAHPSYRQRTILNDSMTKDKFAKFLTAAFDQVRSVCVSGAMVYIVMSAQEWGNIMNVLENLNYHWSSTIIWKKDSLVLSRKDYHTQYEPIWYGWLDSKRVHPLSDRKQSDVWEIPRPKVSDQHPTMKPISLVYRAILNSSKKNDVVIDFFGGSGTTLIAAEQTGRKCRMMELDPKYCDVIATRFANLQEGNAGKISVLRNGKTLSYSELLKDVKTA